jgi:hypothetical protein
VKQSQMMHSFAQGTSKRPPRSSFKQPSRHLTTIDAGDLVPVYVQEVLPGDTLNMRATFFARLNTPLTPIMDNMYLDIHWFYCPNRLLWDGWEDFISGEDVTLTVPVIQITANTVSPGTIENYMGIPLGPCDADEIISLPFRMYNFIYNEWYRPQDIIAKEQVDTDNGPDSGLDYQKLKRAKRHDYFTSCLPWPQKGTEIDLPLGVSAPVIGDGNAIQFWDGNQKLNLIFDTNQATLDQWSGVQRTAGLPRTTTVPSNVDDIIGLTTDAVDSGMIADLTNATAASINTIREAFQLQRMLEKDARGGTRYVENILSHFGVRVEDYRAQRPEYLGGESRRLNITPIAQSSENNTLDDRYVGDLGAIGNIMSQSRFNKTFTEHGFVMCIASIRTDLSYQQGLDRMWSRQDRYDYYWPALALLGEQEVLNKEIYYQADKATTNVDNQVFGYNERYAEYRYKNSLITNTMSSLHPLSLDKWHLAQRFASLPLLNQSFIEEDPPLSRIVAVTSQPDFKFDSFYDAEFIRPMPMYSEPGMIDHF